MGDFTGSNMFGTSEMGSTWVNDVEARSNSRFCGLFRRAMAWKNNLHQPYAMTSIMNWACLSQNWRSQGILTGKWFTGTSWSIHDLPSGKHTKNYGKIHHFSWENSLFLWPFSRAMSAITRGYPRQRHAPQGQRIVPHLWAEQCMLMIQEMGTF